MFKLKKEKRKKSQYENETINWPFQALNQIVVMTKPWWLKHRSLTQLRQGLEQEEKKFEEMQNKHDRMKTEFEAQLCQKVITSLVIREELEKLKVESKLKCFGPLNFSSGTASALRYAKLLLDVAIMLQSSKQGCYYTTCTRRQTL